MYDLGLLSKHALDEIELCEWLRDMREKSEIA